MLAFGTPEDGVPGNQMPLPLLSCFIFLQSVSLTSAQLTVSQVNNLSDHDVSEKSSSLKKQRKPVFPLKQLDWEKFVHASSGQIA